jgi:hypothetical protein
MLVTVAVDAVVGEIGVEGVAWSGSPVYASTELYGPYA